MDNAGRVIIGLTAVGTIAAVISIPMIQPWLSSEPTVAAPPPAGPAEAFQSGISSQEYERTEFAYQLLLRYLERGSIQTLERFAAQNHPEALYLLAVAKLTGIQSPRDLEGARLLYERAWNAGFPRAGTGLGAMLLYGLGGPKDVDRGLQVLEAGARSDSRRSIFVLADFLAFGDPDRRNVRMAVNYVERIVASGDPVGAALQGDMYGAGAGYPADSATAARLHGEAARGGSLLGMFRSGQDYQFGIGVQPDLPRALDLYLAGARGGYGPAAIGASELLISGEAGERSVQRAREALMTAIRVGDAQAKARLARLALNGTLTDVDFATARTMAIEADLEDLPEGLYELAKALRDGAHGAPQDLMQAGQLARMGLRRVELRPLSYEGAYPGFRKSFASILQTALRQGALPPESPDELAQLDHRYGDGPTTTRFTVPMRCGTTRTTVQIYVWDALNPAPPADLQFQWYRLSRGCEPDPGVQDSFTQVFQIARRNNTSYSRLLTDTLSRGSH